MRTLFESLQFLGAVGGIAGLGWFFGMVVGFAVEGKVNAWLVVGPLGVSMLALIIGWALEVAFDSGIKSTIREEESE